MAAVASFYPPSPKTIPEDLTQVSSQYKVHVVLVPGTLLLFIFLYLALVIGAGLLTVVSLTHIRFPFGLPLTIVAGLFFLFLVKGFFKGRTVDCNLQIEIIPEEHPRLFHFINELCKEIDAPFPRRVFISPEVNAAVFYNHESFLGLFLPSRKNLLIGAGLINILNLSEFKAVLAHELGHVAQSSMKFGPYVYAANRIIAEIVVGRDWLDDLLDRLRHGENVSWLGWSLWGILWVFRKWLAGFFYLINVAQLSWSREMEFNADLVAVSVTGSDAIVHSLARLGFGDDCLAQAFIELKDAADHEIHARDLFYHQTQAAPYLRRIQKDPKLGLPPPQPKDRNLSIDVFEPDDDDMPIIWETHPSNYDREQNAKECYIYHPLDARSP